MQVLVVHVASLYRPFIIGNLIVFLHPQSLDPMRIVVIVVLVVVAIIIAVPKPPKYVKQWPSTP